MPDFFTDYQHKFLKQKAQLIFRSPWETQDVTRYVTSIERSGDICNIAVTVKIVFSPDFKYFLDAAIFDLQPYVNVTLYEQDELVFTGYIQKVTYNRNPGASIIVEAVDTYKKALDCFVDPETKSLGENIAFWADKLFTLAGLTYHIDSSFPSTRPVPKDTDFGLRTVNDGLKEIVAYGGGFIYSDPDGTIHFGKGNVPHLPTTLFSGGETYIVPVPPSGIGVMGVYYDTVNEGNWRFNRNETGINFTFDSSGPGNGLNPDLWSAKYLGQIKPDFNEDYIFTLDHKTGGRLWIDDQILIDNWSTGIDISPAITLTSGHSYNLKIEYWLDANPGNLNLYWQSSSLPIEIIPQSHLFPSYLNKGNVITAQHEHNDNMTRNVAYVWGLWPQDQLVTPGQSPYIIGEANVSIPTMPTGRIMVYANSLIQDQTTADIIAHDIVSEFGKYWEIKTIQTLGDPRMRIGQKCAYDLQLETDHKVGLGIITGITTNQSAEGYTMTAKVDEFCPTFAGFSGNYLPTNVVWIAGQTNNGFDAIPDKLVWATGIGTGGQPTYNIVKDIPTGHIQGMHVLIDNSYVFLLMVDPGNHNRRTLYSAPCGDVMSGTATWTEICHESTLTTPTTTWDGTSLDGSYVIDANTTPCIYSLQVVKDTLYIGVTARESPFNHRRHFYGEWKAGVVTWSGPVATPSGLDDDVGCVASYKSIFRRTSSTSKNLLSAPGFGSTIYSVVNFFNAGFDGTSPKNGVCAGTTSNSSVGGIWVNELVDGIYIHPDGVNTSSMKIYRNGVNVYTPVDTNAHVGIHVRGDHYSTQVQFIDRISTTVGRLVGSTDGSSYSTVIEFGGVADVWHGTCICVMKNNPDILFWMRDNFASAGVVARVAYTGFGATSATDWSDMTGNWWTASNSDILNGNAVMLYGVTTEFTLVDIHATIVI